MIILYLRCKGYSLGLGLPATPAEVADRYSKLREGHERTVPVQISEISGPVSTLCPYIQNADLEHETDLQKLNTLAERINNMTQEEQHLFSSALELECTGNLDDALLIAEGLGRYEIFPQIKTDTDLGRFLVITGKFSFPGSAQPYLDYAKIGAEQRETLGWMYTDYGLVKRREEAPMQAEVPKTMLLTLKTAKQSCPLVLPASEEQLDHVKCTLGIEDFSQVMIASVEYVAPYLDQLIPTDCITVENANELAYCLQQIKGDREMMKYCAALEAEEPSSFTEALDLVVDLNNYELVTDNETEYGREALRRIGADDKLLDTIDGYIDFDQLGRAMMEEDGVEQTDFGLVRHLSNPFPPEQEISQTMM